MRINERAQIFFYFLSHFLLTISRRSSAGRSENLFEKMYYDGILEPVQGGGQDFYKLIRNEIYQDETGLKLDVELGQALFG